MQETKTLGQRIQEGRKAAGLSQEAMGEALGVSRQAVSKWEADAAVPELEKLIAMSRLFGCPVGVLLGVETAETPEPDAASSEEPELEALRSRYAAVQKAEGHRWLLPGLVCLVLAVGLLLWVREIGKLRDRVVYLQNEVAMIQTDMRNEIARMGDQIQHILEEEASILSGQSAEVAGFDLEGETVTLRVSAGLKTWTAGAEAAFTAVTSAGERITVPAVLAGDAFVAESLTVPMDDRIEITMAVTEGDSVRTAPVETLHGCSPEAFRLTVQGHANVGWYWSSSGPDVYTVNVKGVTAQTIPLAYVPDLTAERVVLGLYRDRSTRPEWTRELDWDGGTKEFLLEDLHLTYDLAPGQEAMLALELTDSLGRVTWLGLDAKWRTEAGDFFDLERGNVTAGRSEAAETAVLDPQALEDFFQAWTPGTTVARYE